ncbi:MAG TPA: hypothetical protein VGU74_14720, partial [Gemmatimonadales bacterium]|nr:hypothetical protein [Gemmatimonadales bacterium]
SWWLAPPVRLPAGAGLNRTSWDLRADNPPAFTHSFEINANPGLTPASPEGPLVPPGTYTLRLTALGKTYTQPVTVVNDPRSPATAADVQAQYALQTKIVAGMQTSWDAYQQVAALRAAVAADTAASLGAEVIAAAKAFDSTLAAVGGNAERGGGGFGGFGGGPRPAPSFVSVNGNLVNQINALEQGDMAPTPAMLASYAAACNDLVSAVTTWSRIKGAGLTAFNAVVTKHNLQPVTAATPAIAVPVCR